MPGFRPGKAPPRVIKQRFKDQILHDVAHDLIPRAVDDALRERGVEPVDTPDVRDVTIEEGQPLTFTASFDTVPAFEPGDYSTHCAAARRRAAIDDEAVDDGARAAARRAAPVRAGRRPRRRSRRHRRRSISSGARTQDRRRRRATPDDVHKDVSVELGAKANPPGFDEQLLGLEAGRDQDLHASTIRPTTRSGSSPTPTSPIR